MGKSNNPIQKLYDKIKGVKTPAWLYNAGEQLDALTAAFFTAVIVPAIKEIGQKGMTAIVDAIGQEAKNSSKTGAEKLASVAEVGKQYAKNVPNDILNTIINLTYSMLKPKQ